jgi:hypothetical protein
MVRSCDTRRLDRFDTLVVIQEQPRLVFPKEIIAVTAAEKVDILYRIVQ